MYRIMIADDEESIREGVAHLIRSRCPRWEVDAVSRDGLEALERAREILPHAVLTDISMPHMNGLDFLENLMDVLPEVKLLVLSGYDQFEYAVQALRLGVSDYLLKPLESDKLVELLDGFAAELDEQASRREQVKYLRTRAETAGTLELKTFFRYAIRGARLPEATDFVKDYAAGSSYCCVLCNGLEGGTEQLETMLDQRMEGSIRRVLLALEPPAELAVVFWAPPGEDTAFFLTLNHVLGSIAVDAKRTTDRDVRFFIGHICDSPRKLKHSYQRALKARGYAFPEDTAPVTSYEDVLESSLLPCRQIPEQLRRDIPTAVTCGNRAAFFRCCQELFDWFRQERIRDATYMRMCILSLCYAIIHADPDFGTMSYFEFTNFQEEVMAARSLEELRTHFENFARLRWLRQQESPPPRRTLADRVEEIVQAHLSNIDFSLDDVAATLFISPNYLRQLFKQETGQTFTEFLTAQRMHRAKMLLGIPKMRVSDAAEQCGYADSRYFSVCFKKFWHMTPSEYQASLPESDI